MISEEVIDFVLELLEKVRSDFGSNFSVNERELVCGACGGWGEVTYKQIFYVGKIRIEGIAYGGEGKSVVDTGDEIEVEHYSVRCVHIPLDEIIDAVKAGTGVAVSEDEIRQIIAIYERTMRIAKREMLEIKDELEKEKKEKQELQEKVKDLENEITKMDIVLGWVILDNKQKVLMPRSYYDKTLPLLTEAEKVFENEHIIVFKRNIEGRKIFIIKDKEVPNPFFVVRDDEEDILKMLIQQQHNNRDISIIKVQGLLYKYKDVIRR